MNTIPTSTKSGGPTGGDTRASIICLGIDTHATRHTVCRQTGGGTPQPAQSFTTPGLLRWVGRQQRLAARVVCCYEAGPTGFGLQRSIAGLGAECLVIKARNWDSYGRGVKTDRSDARALAETLGRYCAGNRDALTPVRVPDHDEEVRRSLARQREALQREVRRVAAMGRALALYHGHHITGTWWGRRNWPKLRDAAPAFLAGLLETYRECILVLGGKRDGIEAQLHAAAPDLLPKGLGAMTHQLIAREVGDWGRFRNRRQVASYAGLCPRVAASGGRTRQGPINKHGNPRLRRLLVETVWRFIRFQPGWVRLAGLLGQLREKGSPGRKKIAVALARKLAVDLWRLETGQTTPERLGLVMAKPCR